MEYYLNINGEQRGPLDIGEFREMVKNNALSLEDYVWDAKEGEWIKIKFHRELAAVFEEEDAFAAAAGEGFFINVEGKTGGPFPRDAIIKEIERGRFTGDHFVWDAIANRWLKASDHPLFGQFFGTGGQVVATKKYYLSKEGTRFGPFKFSEVEEKILAGEFARDHYIWENTLKRWVKIGEVADFAEVFAGMDSREPEVPPPMPAKTPPPPAPTPPPAAPGPDAGVGLISTPLAASGPGAAGGQAVPPGIKVVPPESGVIKPPAKVAAPPLAAPTVGEPAAPPAAAGPSERHVGDLIPISLPEPPAEAKAAPTEEPTDKVAFRKIADEEEEVYEKARSSVPIDRSVVLDFSKPSMIRRVCAQIVDLFFISLSYFVVALVLSFLDMNPYMPGPEQYYYQQIFWATLIGIGVFYFLVRDAGGASLGKKVMGLRVVKFDDFNRRANLLHSILRNITLLLPLVNILEVIYVFTDVKGRRFGDRLAGTALTEAREIDFIRQRQSILDEIY